MTFAEMHEMMDVLMDKTTMGWLDPSQKDVYLNLALEDWGNWLYDGFEETARRRYELSPLVKQTKFEGKATIDKSDIADLKYIVAVRGEFDFYTEKDGKLVEEKDQVPIEPIGFDELAVAKVDPHRVPTDCFPRYVEYEDTGGRRLIEIHSDNTPTQVEVSYLQDFGTINGLQNPTGRLKIPSSVCKKIVQLAVVKAQGGMTDPRYQTSTIELERAK